MTEAKAKTLSHLVGERIREMREISQVRQEDIAATARKHYGLAWTRATIAALESGKRSLSVEELVLLPLIVSFSHCRLPDNENSFIELQDLIPSSGWVAISRETNVQADIIKEVLAGEVGKSVPGYIDSPYTRRIQEALPKWTEKMTAFAKKYDETQARWPNTKVPWRDFDNEITSDVVKKMATKLRTTPLEIVFASHSLWNRSLAQERDSRLSETDNTRTIQALRGHVTRSLTKDLKQVFSEKISA